MENMVLFFMVVMTIVSTSNAIKRHIKEKKEAELLERNPEAWKKVKELELEGRDRNRRAVGGAAFSIVKILLKK
jgi:hypothetical protein